MVRRPPGGAFADRLFFIAFNSKSGLIRRRRARMIDDGDDGENLLVFVQMHSDEEHVIDAGDVSLKVVDGAAHAVGPESPRGLE